jgi:hypothetical protein
MTLNGSQASDFSEPRVLPVQIILAAKRFRRAAAPVLSGA